MTPQLIKQTLFNLAALASVETMAHFRQNTGVENKLDEGFDPVTAADKNAEKAIRDYIQEFFPSHGILGEEHDAHQTDAEYCWVLDPVDGTRAYISGLIGWGTLIALKKNGVPIAGMMAQPFTKEFYYSVGKESFLNIEKETHPLSTSKVDRIENATLMSTDPHIIAPDFENAFHNLRKRTKLTRYGYDCYAYAMLAAGSIDLVVETDLNSYDICAMIPIIENAGGRITSFDGNSAVDGGNIIAAANQEILDQAIEILNA